MDNNIYYCYSHCRQQENETLQSLFSGRWSELGCETNFTWESTVCKCNHLTYFAILLSAQPLDLPQPKILALQITGYIGVSVSLVAMAATICVFSFLKWARKISITKITLSLHCNLLVYYALSNCPGHFVQCVTTFTSSSVSLWVLLRSSLWQELSLG